MTPAEYKRLRRYLDVSNWALSRALGVSIRAAQRYESGEQAIPEPVARLLRMYSQHGLPPDDRT